MIRFVAGVIGFSPVIKKIYEEYREKIDFNILSGGMVIGEREGLIGDFADYIFIGHTTCGGIYRSYFRRAL